MKSYDILRSDSYTSAMTEEEIAEFRQENPRTIAIARTIARWVEEQELDEEGVLDDETLASVIGDHMCQNSKLPSDKGKVCYEESYCICCLS